MNLNSGAFNLPINSECYKFDVINYERYCSHTDVVNYVIIRMYRGIVQLKTLRAAKFLS